MQEEQRAASTESQRTKEPEASYAQLSWYSKRQGETAVPTMNETAGARVAE
jgi:hypothetical protein